MEYYVTRVVSQSESGITSPEGSRLRLKTLLGSRLDPARCSLSEYIRCSTPLTSCAHTYTTVNTGNRSPRASEKIAAAAGAVGLILGDPVEDAASSALSIFS